jgi:hypothetical protein
VPTAPYTLEQAESDIAELRGLVDRLGEYILTGDVYPVVPGTQTQEIWNYVGAGGQPAFGSGWSNQGGAWANVAFRQLASPANSVQIAGTASNGTAANAAPIFTLPAGYQPVTQQRFPQLENGTVAHSVDVHTDGTVTLETGSAGTGTYFLAVIFSLDL